MATDKQQPIDDLIRELVRLKAENERLQNEWDNCDEMLQATRTSLERALSERAGGVKVKALAEDAKKMCEEGHPVSAFNLAQLILTALTTEPAAPGGRQEAVPQFRKAMCVDWYDGFPDHSDGGGPYETRVLYTRATEPAAPEERQSSERTCATCHAVLADGPQPFATYAPDTRPAEQAVTEAARAVIEWYERDGSVGGAVEPFEALKAAMEAGR